MLVYCPECGGEKEMDGRQWSPKLRCEKCGLGILERAEPHSTDDILRASDSGVIKTKRPYKKVATTASQPEAKLIPTPFMVYQEDLSRLPDKDFEEVWQAIGKIIRIMGKLA